MQPTVDAFKVTVPLALLGWLPIASLLFVRLPRSRAVILAFLGAEMWLPTAGYAISGLPDYTKTVAATYSVCLATLLFGAGRLRSFRPSLFDAPMALWCLCPLLSSMANGLGVRDGLSGVLGHTLLWGLPYLLGRLYLPDTGSLRELAVCLLIGGLIYVPLCLFEIRMSPQLNQWVYGFGASGVEYGAELGAWGSRPRVFMGNGLALGMFMTAVSLAGAWLWVSGTLKTLWGYSVGWLVVVLICTTFLCKNMGALMLLIAGLVCLAWVRYARRSTLVYALIATAPLYMMLRGTGRMGGDAMVSIVGSIHQRRADSLQTRLDNEDQLVEKAMLRPVFGWGGWGRSRVFDEEGKDITLADGLWVIVLGTSGLVGLGAVTAAMLLPAIAFIRRYPVRTWLHPVVGPGGCLAVFMALYAIDCLFNAMLNPVYLLAAGGLVSAAAGRAVVASPGRRPVRMRAVAAPVVRRCQSP